MFNLNLSHFLYLSIALVFLSAANGDILWTDAGTDSNWNNSDNWSNNIVPDPSTDVRIQVFDPQSGPVVNEGETVYCNRLKIRDSAMYVNSGVVNVSYWGGAGSWGGIEGSLHINGDGQINVADIFHVGHSQKGELILNDNAVVNVNSLIVANTDGVNPGQGRVDVLGGEIRTGNLTIYNDGLNSFGSVNIAGGQIVIDANVLNLVDIYQQDGRLTAYNGRGDLLVTYDQGLDQTLITGLYGDFDGNKSIDIRDFVIFADYWVSDQYSLDINEDSLVDITELQAFTNYWLDVYLVSDVSITVNVNNAIRVSGEHLIGMNMSYWRDTDQRWSDGVIASRMIDVNATLLRWPGGGEAAVYHWQECPGAPAWKDSWETNPNSEYYFSDPNDCYDPDVMDIDEFLYWCYDVIGAEAAIGVNFESGWRYDRLNDSIAEAVSLVQYCKDKGYNVKYWYIGNEPGSAFISDSDYAMVIDLFADAMKQVDPDIEIIAYITAKLGTSHIIDRYSTMLTESGGNLDYCDGHFYWSRLSATWDKWLNQNPLLSEIHDYVGPPYTQDFENWYQNVAELGEDAKLVSLEWSAGIPAYETWQADTMSPYQCGLVNAEIFMNFIYGGVEMACLYPSTFSVLQTRNPGRGLINPDTYEPWPTYHILQLFGDAVGKEVLSCTSSRVNLPVISVLKNENELAVYALNKSASKTAVKIDVSAKNIDRASAREVVPLYGINGDFAEIVNLNVLFKDNSVLLELDPYGLAVIYLDIGE